MKKKNANNKRLHTYLIDVEIADDFIKASVQIVEEVDNL